MKKLLFVTLLFFSTTIAFSQNATKSDLYLKVVEVMRTELNYSYDADTGKREKPKADTATTNVKITGRHSVPIDWPPLIIMDGKPLNVRDLNKYTLEVVETIEAKKDKATTALYGNSSKNGVIYITTKTDK